MDENQQQYKNALERAKAIAAKMKANMKDPERMKRLAEEQEQAQKKRKIVPSPYGPSVGQKTTKSEIKVPYTMLSIVTPQLLKTMEKECNVIMTLVPGDVSQYKESVVAITGTDPEIAVTKNKLHELMYKKVPDVTVYAPRDKDGNIKIYLYVDGAKVGSIIGGGGQMIKQIQERTGALVSVDSTNDSEPNNTSKAVIIQGQERVVIWAKRLVEELIEDGIPEFTVQPGDNSIISEVMKVPNDKVGLVIGKGGENIKSIQKECSVKLTIETSPDSEGERHITITGRYEDVQRAKEAVEERVHGNRGKYTIEDNGYDYAFSGPVYSEYQQYQYGTTGAQYDGAQQYDASQAYSYDPNQQFDYNSKEYAEYYAQYYAQQGYAYDPNAAAQEVASSEQQGK